MMRGFVTLAALTLLVAAAPVAAAQRSDEAAGELDFLSTGGVVPAPGTNVEVEVEEGSPPVPDDGDDEGSALPALADEPAADDDTPDPGATDAELAASTPASQPETQPASQPVVASTEPWLSELPDCLAPLMRRQPALVVSRDEQGVVIDHSCSSWGVAPTVLRHVAVGGSGAGEEAAIRTRLAFKEGDQVVRTYDARLGDQMNGGAVLVGVGPGIALFAAGGRLFAATDGAPVKTWRMVWHSSFVLAADSAGSTAAGPAAGSPRDAVKGKAVAKPKLKPGGKK